MREEPKAWRKLLERLALVTSDHLSAQIRAGAEAVQLFDSWAGTLSKGDYETHVWPHSREVFARVKSAIRNPQSAIPLIHFGTQTGPFLERFADVEADVISVDVDVPLGEAWKRIGNKALQGNLDPRILLTDPDNIKREASKILDQAGGRPGHIFNLGHGILPSTPVEHVQMLVEFIHHYRRERQ
jgi:uroporphyrinogen decarboxylase